MPDVFVAPEEKHDDTTIMHKRTPASTTEETPSFQPSPPPVIEHPIIQEQQPIIEQAPKPTPPPIIEDEPESPPIQPLHSPENIAHRTMHEHHTNFAVPLFTSFWQNPHGVYFDTQEVNEHILLFLRRHFVTNVPWLFFSVLFMLFPPIISILFNKFNYSVGNIPTSFVNALLFAYYLSIFTYAFLNFLDWYYNISLITPKRVMDVEMNNLVGKKISATKISLVQDISYQQAGTIRSVFNYGDVLIQTAGTQDNFYVHAVPKPEVVVRVVENLIGKRQEDEEHAGI